jgi:hypothetical protein
MGSCVVVAVQVAGSYDLTSAEYQTTELLSRQLEREKLTTSPRQVEAGRALRKGAVSLRSMSRQA